MREGECVEGRGSAPEMVLMTPEEGAAAAADAAPAAGQRRVEEVLVDEPEAGLLGQLPELSFSLEEWEALYV